MAAAAKTLDPGQAVMVSAGRTMLLSVLGARLACSGSVHLEWRECVNAQEVQYLWHCGNCKNEFVTVVTSDEKEPPVTEITERFFTSLLV
jgi:hypothetical protein